MLVLVTGFLNQTQNATLTVCEFASECNLFALVTHQILFKTGSKHRLVKDKLQSDHIQYKSTYQQSYKKQAMLQFTFIYSQMIKPSLNFETH